MNLNSSIVALLKFLFEKIRIQVMNMIKRLKNNVFNLNKIHREKTLIPFLSQYFEQ